MPKTFKIFLSLSVSLYVKWIVNAFENLHVQQGLDFGQDG